MFGVPIISTNCNSGPREILLDGKGGDLIKIFDYKELSKKIISNLNHRNSKKIKKVKNNLKRFSIKKNIDSYQKMFEEI